MVEEHDVQGELMELNPKRIIFEGRDRLTMEFTPQKLKRAIGSVLSVPDSRFMTISAVDNGILIELNYHIHIPGTLVTIRTKVRKKGGPPVSVTGIVPAADLIEHEISEFFGVEFEGNPRAANIFLPEKGSAMDRPLRGKDGGPFPIGTARMMSSIATCGCSVQVSSRVRKVRDQLGLRTEEETCGNELLDIAERTGVDREHGHDIEKKEVCDR